MRVKITSTCDISEASSIVVNILARAQEELRALSNKKFNYWQVSELLTQINSLRSDIADIDHGLDDATSIASGWLEVILEAAQNPDQESDPTTQGQEDNIDEQKEEI